MSWMHSLAKVLSCAPKTSWNTGMPGIHHHSDALGIQWSTGGSEYELCAHWNGKQEWRSLYQLNPGYWQLSRPKN